MRSVAARAAPNPSSGENTRGFAALPALVRCKPDSAARGRGSEDRILFQELGEVDPGPVLSEQRPACMACLARLAIL